MAYNILDKTPLKQVLSRIGVSPQMLAVIQQFHDDMRVCVRPDNGVCSDRFEAKQGLRQRCLLSLLLFKIYSAVVLTVVLQRFIQDAAILAELAHLKKPPTSMALEPAMDYVCRSVWGMLYADDTCIDSRPPQGFAKMIKVIVQVFRSFASTVSANKTKTISMTPPRTSWTMAQVEAIGQSYKQGHPGHVR